MKFTITRQYDAPLDEAHKILDMAVLFEKIANCAEELLDQPYPAVDATLRVLEEEYDLVLAPRDAIYDAQQQDGE